MSTRPSCVTLWCSSVGLQLLMLIASLISFVLIKCFTLSLTTQAKYVERNIEARSRNHCCSDKAVISIAYCECVQVQHVACSAHVPYCQLSPFRLYNIFVHYFINGTIFENMFLCIKCVF